MPSESQATFFSRITTALADRDPAVELPELPQDLNVARVVSADNDLLALFVQRVGQAGMCPHRVANEQAAVVKIAELVRSISARSAIIPNAPLPGRDAIVLALEQQNVQLLNPDDPDAGFVADVGITGVRLAVAETASMSVVSGQAHRRLASLAVPVHIAIVRADQIVADLLDWGQEAPGQSTGEQRINTALPANEVLISAMSKTADIEGILVPGVHGPETVHVVIIE
ncbi:MAG: lactate utilization protein [Phycisphaerae bacterium]|nr:lactate utilization protein [Phycisphaerae bacterium]